MAGPAPRRQGPRLGTTAGLAQGSRQPTAPHGWGGADRCPDPERARNREAPKRGQGGSCTPLVPRCSPGLSSWDPKDAAAHSPVRQSVLPPPPPHVRDWDTVTEWAFEGDRIFLGRTNKSKSNTSMPKGPFYQDSASREDRRVITAATLGDSEPLKGGEGTDCRGPTLQFWHIPPTKRGCSRVTLRLPQEMQMSGKPRGGEKTG